MNSYQLLVLLLISCVNNDKTMDLNVSLRKAVMLSFEKSGYNNAVKPNIA